MLQYMEAGLVEEKEADDGRRIYQIRSEATNGSAVYRALTISGWIGAIIRAAKDEDDARWTIERIKELADELGLLQYMAGGFEVCGWASHISRSFEDVGGFLRDELWKLTRDVGDGA